MKHLTLLRHAKSAWDDALLPDHERPLAPRGAKACRQLATWIEDARLRPQLVVCSTAARARQTLEPLLGPLGVPEVSYENGLYHASARWLADRVAALDPAVDDVMFVGHNPGLQDLALLFSSASAARDRIAAKLPTGALVRLELEGGWEAFAPGSVEIAVLIEPRELR